MARQGQKLTDELKEQIKAHLVQGNNLNQTAKQFNVSVSTVSKIRDEKPDEFENLRKDKKAEMIDKLWDNIVDAAELGHMMIREAREGKRDIPLGQISTYLGTLYDKRALMNNESTANTTTTVKLEGELAEWAK